MRRLLVLTAVLTTALGVVTPAAADSVITVPGLREPVQLIDDRWGVPHLFARNTADLFLAQGFNVAKDRLFQIDLARRRGLGLLSEVLGPSYVDQDTAARLFLYRGDMTAEWNSYGPDARLAATQFTAGINAYVDWLAQHPTEMPAEFRKLGYTPSHWSPEDIVRIRSNGLIGNAASEVARSQVACAGGAQADRLRVPLEPAHEETVPAGFDPCSLPADVLRTYQLATQPVAFTGTSVQALTAETPDFTEGSNNWAISPSRTATGRPILANDPHRAYGEPSLRYLVQLSAPGLDAIGAGEPSQPGISLGHTDSIAFGLTVFPTDQEDLYVYQLDPNDPTRYRYGDGWERMTQVTERIPVAGGQTRTVTEQYTRHGPVIKVDAVHHTAYAIRTVWSQPGTAPYLQSLKLLRTKNFTQFTEAMRGWGTPSENQAYADTRGNIGWAPGGLTPKRIGYDGLFPVPGDGRYEWSGFFTGDDLPRSLNPASGLVVTANQMNLPPGYQDKGLGYEWGDAVRYQRITDVLSANAKSTVADSTLLQTDQTSLYAQRIVALLHDLAVPEMIKQWDGVVGVDSAPAALYEVWRKRYLGPALLRAAVPAAASLIVRPNNSALVDALEHPDTWLGGAANRDQLLTSSLAEAYAATSALLGADPSKWKWGDLQFTLFQHPLAPLLSAEDRARFNVGPIRHGGDETTVNASGFQATNFQQTGGPTVRMVFDVGNWDASRAVNSPGQSGDPDSPHYRDLAPLWAAGTTFPLLYSRAAVELNAQDRFLLVPGR
ncbi:penicillin acylase family protein [Kutzneria chonburiensis]|uniref:Penicillin acylase family protein n=1 Tax=Kutzneria chonburiensis TaxID=1483604 RepID=A0ABV6MQ88_9PSEU|nr:penicillin acylase family protein [Kutzneria chonburiensis]